MAVNVTRTSSLFTDSDSDGVVDPGDIVLVQILVKNTNATDILNLKVYDTQNGLTVTDLGTVRVTPIAFDDFSAGAPLVIGGNTPYIITASALLGNDVDPDHDGTPALTVSSFTNLNHVTITDLGGGSFQIVPETGYQGVASFDYHITDEQGLTSVDPGRVHLSIQGLYWYVDSGAATVNGDGSYLNPFKNLDKLNGATGDGTTNDDVDGDGNTIFIYDRGTDVYTSGITLENNQKLYGDGYDSLVVNGFAIGGSSVTTNSTFSMNGTMVKLASGNTVSGLDLVGTGVNAVGIQDNGASTVGTLNVSNVGYSGAGRILDLDHGGTINVGLNSVSTTGAVGDAAINLIGVQGSLTIAGNASITGNHSAPGMNFSGSSSALAVTLQGDVNVDIATGATLVTGVVSFANNASGSSLTMSGGSKIIDAAGSNGGLYFSGNSNGALNITGGNLDITSVNGTALIVTNGGTATITGDGNSIGSTGTGSIANLVNTTIGAGGINVATLEALGTVTGTGFNIDNVNGGNFASGSTFVAGSTLHNVNVNNSSVDVSLGSGSLAGSGAGSSAVRVNLNNGDFDFNGSIAKSSDGNIIAVSNKTGGTVQFDGTVAVSSGADGINLTSNTGATINFTNTLTLTTSASNTTAFNATGGGTVSATGAASTISSGSGVAINVDNTNIGAADLNFQSVNVNGAANGIVLNATGSLGGLTITGVGTTAGSGGTIQNTTGRGVSVINGVDITLKNMNFTNAGTTDSVAINTGLSLGQNTADNAAIHLQNVTNATLDRIAITGGAEHGINGHIVANFNLSNSTITGVGNASDEDGIHFYNMSGRSSIASTVISNSGDDNVNIQTQSGQLDLSITGNGTLAGGSVSGGVLGSGYLFGIRGTSIANITIDDVISQNNFSGGIVLDAYDSATLNARVNSVDSLNNNDQIQVSISGAANADADITNSTFTSTTPTLDFVNMNLLGAAFSTGILDVRVHNNNFNILSGVMADAIVVNQAGGGQMNVGMTSNTINYAGTQRAVLVQGGTDGNGTLAATIQSNTVDMKNGGALASPAFLIQTAITGPGNTTSIDLNMGGTGLLANNFIHSGGGTIAAGDIRVRQRNDGSINLDGYSGGGQDVAAVAAYLNARNNEISPSTATVDGTTPKNYTGNATSNFVVVSVSAAQVNEDGATNLVYTFTRAGNVSSALTTNFAITGTATAGTDYSVSGAASFSNATGLGAVTFAAGSATATITVDPTADGAFEFAESVVVDAARGSFARALIANDDAALSVQVEGPQLGGNQAAGGNPGPSPAAGNGGGTVTPPAAAPGSGPAAAPPAVVDDGILSQAELNLMVAAAIDRWAAAGATAEQVAAMRAVDVRIADMAGLQIGGAGQGLIRIDNDAAGYGWFVDSTPGDDSEFSGSGTRLFAAAGGGAAGHVDLLTVLVHELGHQIGLEDDYRSDDGVDAMYGYMDVGERRLPTAGAAARADGHAPAHEAFILAPVANVGTLPTGKSVRIEYQATVDSYFNQVISPLSNKATVKGDNIADTDSNTNVTVIDTLTLGDRVFVDANNNGTFDAGEGRNGVALTLFADSNNNGVLDIGTDVQLLTTTTAGAGAAAGTYSFASLSAGNYIVRVDASNFSVGGALVGTRGVFGGVDPDGDAVAGFNVDNDDNGIAGPSGSVVAAPISLAYNTEPTSDGGAIPKNDINNTLDFGFVVNTAPVANADSLTATEDTPAQYSTELTGNDTDADLDTLTVTAVSNVVNGTASVAGGVVTFTPNSNFHGTASFDYTISDGNGHTSTATATVTVSAVNDPVGTTAPATATLNEDSVDFAVTGMSISDADSALTPSGVYQATLSATQGTLKLSTVTGLTFATGDGDGDTTMTFSGTLADINVALATAKYTPTANYAGAAEIKLEATDSFGGVVATGTGAATTDSDTIAVTVNQVNDAPTGADKTVSTLVDGRYVFTLADFGFSDSDGNSLLEVLIMDAPDDGTIYYDSDGDNQGNPPVAMGPNQTLFVSKSLIENGGLYFLADSNESGSPYTSFKFKVRDNGGTDNGGVDLSSESTITINVPVPNVAPVLDLNGDGAGTGFSASYMEGAAAAGISDTDVLITDADSGDMVEGATITIANAVAGDVLTVVGLLPGSITVHASTTDTNLVLTGTGTQAQYEAAIEQITFSNTGGNPTVGGTNTSRTINVTVTDGNLSSEVAVATITVADDNADAPTGADSTITATEDAFRLLQAGDLGFSDVDGTFASVTISAVSGGKIYVDADGSAGANPPVEATLSATFTAQDLIDGKASFRADPNLNGTGVASITFTVTDDDGNVATASNTLTVNVTAVNDSPVLTTGGPIAATEQTAVAILPSGSVADVELDALNGGLGDYKGASFGVNRNPATNAAEDRFSLVAGPSFTIDGSNLKAGGLIFGTISVDGSAGMIVINFDSLETKATSALVDEVIQGVRYTNISDTPPASVDLAVGFDDGSPGSGQGSGGPKLDVNVVTVNIAATNDAPAVDLNGGGAGFNAVLNFSESFTPAQIAPSATVSDVDSANFDGGSLTVAVTTNAAPEDFLVIISQGSGAGEIGLGAASTVTYGGTSIGTWSYSGGSGQINVSFNADATPEAVQALVRQIGYFTNSDTPTTAPRGILFALTDGDGGTTNRTATVNVTPVDDAAVAQPDGISTFENAVGTGSLFADNGSGPDSDAEGNSFAITEITVGAQTYAPGAVIDLPSGAKLVVNANGTYSYNPNGKFNKLTDNSSGAVNTSAESDTFSYTVTGGDTATVTVTVKGVAGPGDWLMGDGSGNTITGTPQADLFVVSQGGNDTVTGLASDDIFYFGGALTADDNVNGGAGFDTIALQGDYSGGLVLDGSVTDIESISMLAGTNVTFGNPGLSLYDYDVTIHDSNFAAGVQAKINAAILLTGEDFRFDGSAETDAKLLILAGRGQDELIGGAGNDTFFFAEDGRFAAGDTVDGGDGYDGFFLRGTYTIDFTQAGFAGAFVNVENMTLSSASDQRYARSGGPEFDYSITWDDDLLGNGQAMTINGALLMANETMVFDGSDESNGSFKILAGASNDTLTGGAGNDVIVGGLGVDILTGGAGNDVFRFDSAADSTLAGRDEVRDFADGDLIDLSKIDANALIGGNQAFNFIGTAAFSNTAGELRYESMGGTQWLIQGDTDGNGVSDFEVIVIIAVPDPITSGDFNL